jgi:hypothetical protein
MVAPAAIDPLLDEMQNLIDQWQLKSDQRAIFLACYHLMTGNMLLAVERGEFNDAHWTRQFVYRFAEYYFEALHAYNQQAETTPPVWRVAHDTCRKPDIWALQKLLLGINAHINYDLVLTVEELVRPEWKSLTRQQRASRLADYLHVNDIIAATIDEVQDDVLEPGMPAMRLIDVAFGPADEWVLSRLLHRWRGRVWSQAIGLLSAGDYQTRQHLIRQVERKALRRARAIQHPYRLTCLHDLV